MGSAQVLAGTHLRLMRMLFRALPSSQRTLTTKHVDFIETFGSFWRVGCLVCLCGLQSRVPAFAFDMVI